MDARVIAQEQPNPEYLRLMQRTLRLRREGFREFDRALSRARKAASRNPELAVHWCRYGASVAMLANPGIFYSHEMEQLLGEIASRSPQPPSSPWNGIQSPARFLHLTTTTSAMGGHTRAISRWIETCAEVAPSEHHSILISRQRDEPVPDWIKQSARRTGGDVFELPSPVSWLQAAAETRARASEFDVVVLHTEPNDPLPNLAFHDRAIPVMYFNHTDHVFSLGTDVASVIADIRTIGYDLSVRYRSPQAGKVLLPLPLLDKELTPTSREDARRELGLPIDAPIILTIGEPYKFSPLLGYSFSELVQSLCTGNPDLLIVGIGISESEPFPDLQKQTQGRFRPLGFIMDRKILDLYYCAADVYMDSFPCGSLTATLDAARRGLPVQRFANPYQRLLWYGEVALDSVASRPSTLNDYVAQILDCLRSPKEKRVELGSQFRKSVLQEHCGASWKSRWLDPAVNSLCTPCAAHAEAGAPQSDGETDPFLGMAGLNWGAHWPAGMFAASAILGTDRLPRAIRLSGVWHSIRPFLFDTVGDGMAAKRFLMFRWLLASIWPRSVFSALRRLLRKSPPS